MMPRSSSFRGHVLMTADALGGVWTHSASLAQELARRGWMVTLVTLGPAPRKHQFLPLLTDPRIDLEITDLELEWQDPDGEDQERCGWYLAAIEQRIDPDIVHLNGCRQALAGFRSAVLVTAHSCIAPGAAAGGSAYAAQIAAGLDAADLWVAPTAAFREWVQTKFQPDSTGRVVWHGIGAGARPAPKQPVVLCAGRLWDEAKNIAVLPEAAAGLEWPLRVAGALHQPGIGPKAVAVHGQVEWLGDLHHGELLAALSEASIFVSPALNESFGLTVLEAAASGCALVLADIPAFRELWDGAAVFADPTDPAALGTAMRQLSQNEDLRRDLAAAALLRSQRYSLTATADAYEELYGEMMLSARRRRSAFRSEALEVRA